MSQSDREPQPVAPASPVTAPDTASAPRKPVGRLRVEIPLWQSLLCGALCIAALFGLWYVLTAGEVPEERYLSPTKLPSLGDTFGKFENLWFDSQLTRNTYASLRRVVLGFSLAVLVGVPLGVLCGCFSRVAAFVAPLTIFGRNIPMAALIPLSIIIFGIDEMQKVMFVFIAAVAFIVSDSAQAVQDVATRYVDTAYTLGASRLQVILKVLVPLAMPQIFNSLRLLFGLAFGYIMLAEVIQIGDVSGLGGIINVASKRGPREYIYLVLMIIPLIALGIDRLLFWVQKQLFPYQYGGPGLLAQVVRFGLHSWGELKALFITPVEIHMVMPGVGVGGPTQTTYAHQATPTDKPKPNDQPVPTASTPASTTHEAPAGEDDK